MFLVLGIQVKSLKEFKEHCYNFSLIEDYFKICCVSS